jgi:hypothetical protein
LKNVLSKKEWKRYIKLVRTRWHSLLDAGDTPKALEVLKGVVDENLRQLDAKIAEFDARLREKAQRTVNLLAFDDTPRGERMRRWQMKCVGAFVKAIACYRRVRGSAGGCAAGEKVDTRKLKVEHGAPPAGTWIRGGADIPASGGGSPTRADEGAGGAREARTSMADGGNDEGRDPPGPPLKRGGGAGGRADASCEALEAACGAPTPEPILDFGLPILDSGPEGAGGLAQSAATTDTASGLSPAEPILDFGLPILDSGPKGAVGLAQTAATTDTASGLPPVPNYGRTSAATGEKDPLWGLSKKAKRRARRELRLREEQQREEQQREEQQREEQQREEQQREEQQLEKQEREEQQREEQQRDLQRQLDSARERMAAELAPTGEMLRKLLQETPELAELLRPYIPGFVSG